MTLTPLEIGTFLVYLAAVIGTGDRAHLMLPADHPELPWTVGFWYSVLVGCFVVIYAVFW